MQVKAVGQVLEGRSVLVSSPTGSGKTLAAFLGIFNYLAKLNSAGPLAQLGFDDVRVGMRTDDTPIRIARRNGANRRASGDDAGESGF